MASGTNACSCLTSLLEEVEMEEKDRMEEKLRYHNLYHHHYPPTLTDEEVKSGK